MTLAPTLTLGAAAWRFASPTAILLLGVVPFVVALLWFGFVRARRGLIVFAGPTPHPTVPGPARAGLKIVLIAIGLSSLTLALARPQADPVEETVTVRGRDVVFILDVSRSMLSRDAVPNRLARAKLWINDLVNTLQGDRVGLVAFAGAAVVKCPLTMDYGFFRMALDELTPASVPRGGTLIGDAIRKAMSDVFEPGPGRYRDIVLITDGEDQGSFPAEAAKQPAEQGVRLIAIGIGSEIEGAPVPAGGSGDTKYVEYEGKRVRSRLDETTLSKIAEAAAHSAGESGGGGVFLNVGTGTINLDKVYHDLIGSSEKREVETKSNVVYRELFPYFLVIAALCLAIEPAIAGRRRVSILRSAAGAASIRKPMLVAASVIAMCAAVPARAEDSASPPTAVPPGTVAPVAPARPMAADALYNSGRELFLAGKYSEAAERFRSADIASPDPELSARARFNLGQSLLKEASPQEGKPIDPAQTKARLKEAAQAFRSAFEAKPGDAEAARNVEIARRMLSDLEEQQEKQKQQEQQQQQSDKNQQKDAKSGENQEPQNQGGDQQEQGDKSAQQHQDNADKMKDLADQQNRAADQSKKSSQQKNSEERQNERRKAENQQESVSEKTEQQRQESAQSTSEEAKKKLNEAQKEQRAASEALKQGDEKKAEEHQRNAAELLNDAAKAEQEAAQQAKQSHEQKQSKQDQQSAATKAENKQQPKDEKPKYNETASQLLDKERRERDARQQVLRALRGKPVPVEKDW